MSKRRSAFLKILVGLELFLGIGACIGGALLIVDPSGASLGVASPLVAHSPLASFKVPGFVLFSLFGLGSCFVGGAAWAHLPGALRLSKYLALALIVWMPVQGTWIRLELPFQSLLFFYGVIISAFAQAEVRRRQNEPPADD